MSNKIATIKLNKDTVSWYDSLNNIYLSEFKDKKADIYDDMNFESIRNGIKYNCIKVIEGKIPDEECEIEHDLTSFYNKKEIDEKVNNFNEQFNTILDKVGDETTGLIKDVNNLKNNAGGIIVSSIEPTDNDIPRLFLSEGTLPTTKDSTTMKIEYKSKTKSFSGYADIKCQGTSSMAYPKKNFTIKVYSDVGKTTKLKQNFRNWGSQYKFCMKANYIDVSHARNVVSSKIWSDCVKSRSNFESLPTELKTSANVGAIDGFFVKVYSNGVYQGRYTMNIPKDAWMCNMDSSLDTHCILCGENYVSGCFRGSANINGSDWSDELHDVVPTSIKTRWNEVISFVMNSNDTDFKTNLSNYFDVESLIDYYCFQYAICGLDSMGKNQLYLTYDGQKWIANSYDMDSTWGLYWNGSSFISSAYRMQEDYESGTSGRAGNLLYERLENLYTDEIKARYSQLRKGALSLTNIINKFEEFMICNSDLVKEDYEIFTGIPSQTTNNLKQIRKYAIDRLSYVDTQISSLAPPIEPIPCTSITLSSNSLTFTDNTTQTLTSTVLPSNTTDSIIWSESPTGICSVNKGVVTPISNGSCVITATCGTQTATCNVTISGLASISENILASNYSPNGENFTLYAGEIDFSGQGLVAEMDFTNCTVINENVLSIGTNITTWAPTLVNIHIYYTQNTKTLQINLINSNRYLFKTEKILQSNINTIKINMEGIYLNGELINSSFPTTVNGVNYIDVLNSLVTRTAATTKYISIGSQEGNIRSHATYNKVSIPPSTIVEVDTNNELFQSANYKLTTSKTFNGTSDYVDTGITLFDTIKDFSIFLEFNGGDNTSTQLNLLHCMKEVSPYPGLSISKSDINSLISSGQGYNPTITNTINKTRRLLICTYSATTNTMKIYHDSANTDYVNLSPTSITPAFIAIPQTALLGAYQDSSGVKGRFWNGKINICGIWLNKILTDDEISKLLIF